MDGQDQHTVSKFLLRRFARDGKVARRARDGGPVTPAATKWATTMPDFYDVEQRAEVPAASLDKALAAIADEPIKNKIVRREGESYVLVPDAMETLLGVIETTAAPAIERLVVDGPPSMSNLDRSHISLFLAFQITRGRAFRRSIDESARAFVRASIESDPKRWAARRRKAERRDGIAPADDPLRYVLDELDSVKLNEDPKLGLMATLADQTAPLLFGAAWCVREFDAPDVLISDEPVALWARPSRDLDDDPLGVSTADAIFCPIGPRHSLQIRPHGLATEDSPGVVTAERDETQTGEPGGCRQRRGVSVRAPGCDNTRNGEDRGAPVRWLGSRQARRETQLDTNLPPRPAEDPRRGADAAGARRAVVRRARRVPRRLRTCATRSRTEPSRRSSSSSNGSRCTTGSRVLDLGCGPGPAFARAGATRCRGRRYRPLGGVRRARAAGGTEPKASTAEFRAADVRDLDEHDAFDAVICLCQGGFGLLGGRDDEALIARFAAALKPGGRLALSAFHVAFAVRFLETGDRFDPATGVHHERATLRDPDGAERDVRPVDDLLHAARAAPPGVGRRARRRVGRRVSRPGQYGRRPARRSNIPNCSFSQAVTRETASNLLGPLRRSGKAVAPVGRTST